jgi:hypothetical protein
MISRSIEQSIMNYLHEKLLIVLIQLTYNIYV